MKALITIIVLFLLASFMALVAQQYDEAKALNLKYYAILALDKDNHQPLIDSATTGDIANWILTPDQEFIFGQVVVYDIVYELKVLNKERGDFDRVRTGRIRQEKEYLTATGDPIDAERVYLALPLEERWLEKNKAEIFPEPEPEEEAVDETEKGKD